MTNISTKLAPNHPLAYLFVAFVATAGIFYINIQPGIVSALVEGLGFTDQQAGRAMAMNSYGATLGAFLAFFWLGGWHWKYKIASLFLLLITIELTTQFVSSPQLMTIWRFLAGTVGGVTVGLGFSILSRLNSTDRAFGTLLALQFLLGSVIIYIRSWIEAQVGVYGVFYVLAIFVAVSLCMVFFLDDYDVAEQPVDGDKPAPGIWSQVTGIVVLALLAVVLYQSSANAVWTYVERIGAQLSMPGEQVSTYVSSAFLLSMPAALIPILIGNRFGRLPMIASGIVLASAGVLLLAASDDPSLYFTGSLLLNISWAYTLAYLLALVASFDKAGRIAILGGTASKLGLATGPMLGSTLIGDGSFTLMLICSTAGFALCLLLALRPTLTLDRQRSTLRPAENTI